MFCKNCGTKMEDHMKFCPKCGTAASKPETVMPAEPVMNTNNEQSGNQEKNGGKKFLIATLCILFILFLVAIIGVGYLAISSMEKDDRYEETTDSKDADDEDEESGENDNAEDGKEEKPIVEDPILAYMNIRQVDNTNFPNMTFYATIFDEEGKIVEEVDVTDFVVQEIDINGTVTEIALQDVYKVIASADDHININLVLDASGSMDSSSKMQQARTAANSFIDKVDLSGGDRVEIISFDDYVYLEQEFTSDKNTLNTAINNIDTAGATALYDALYAGVFQTYYEEGAKCVIGFTDGQENASSYSFEDVVGLSQSTGIPVYIIGIGDEYDVATLQNLAAQCGGEYYSAGTVDLAVLLEEIYLDIYQEQQDYYVFEYVSQDNTNLHSYREILVTTTQTSEFALPETYRKDYVPVADLTGAFSAEYSNLDYMIPDSSTRMISEADLAGMSLAQLRIARNEIYARHGRQFKDSMLNQWFYSKVWYLNIPQKYAPDYFDSHDPSPLSQLEIDNINLIVTYENAIMASQDIYPNASNVLLTEYDLGLSKQVLTRAYDQMLRYPSTDILNQNLTKVQDAINKEDIQY